MRTLQKLLLVLALLAGFEAHAEDTEPSRAVDTSINLPSSTYCPHLKKQAAEYEIPGLFFIRLIWKESRFNPNAVSPKGAQGIAQFMPGTAYDRGLDDPFDPYAAIRESARFVRDLMDKFGNPGLAAAAYNAGPYRVQKWLSGQIGLPWETQDFVAFITGMPAEYWRMPGAELTAEFQDSPEALTRSCIDLARLAAPVSPETAGAKWQPWGMQLAADFSRARALSRFALVQGRYASLLARYKPMIVRKRNLSFGRRPRYAIRIGAGSRKEADILCQSLRKAGGACIVSKN